MGRVGKKKLGCESIFVWSHIEHHQGCSKIFIMGGNMDSEICSLTKHEHEFVKVKVCAIFFFGGATCTNCICMAIAFNNYGIQILLALLLIIIIGIQKSNLLQHYNAFL